MNTIALWDGRAVPRLGLGCWAIGGPITFGGVAASYGPADDGEAMRAIRRGYDLGVRLFDTAENYGMGHSEELLGEALAGRDDAVIVTKFGYDIDSAARAILGVNASPARIRQSIEGSLRRLRRERIDAALFHVNDHPAAEAGPVFDTLAALKAEGKIGAFGWSTDYPDRLAAMAGRPGFAAVEFDLNVLIDAPAMVAEAERRDLLAFCRLPLAMGFLSDRFGPDSRLPTDDVRGAGHAWVAFFENGRPSPRFLELRARIRDLLRTDGRTVVQGALAWLLARSPRAVPIPGFHSVAQVEENAKVLEKGPLPADAMAEIERLMGR
jgi:aryl-alcohol dehydrogenase-like predicted oxidoreductase